MPARKPIAPGTKFGHWTVVERSTARRYNSAMYICECSCGRRVDVDARSLRNNRSSRCYMCARRSMKLDVLPKSLDLLRSGLPTAVIADKIGVSTCTVNSWKRTLGLPRPKHRVKDLMGERFGRWTVVAVAEQVNGFTAWTCECTCGRRRVVRAADLRRGASKSCQSCAMKERRKRERGTVSPLEAALKRQAKWDRQRRAVAASKADEQEGTAA
jgi:hypothetical protein